MNQARHWSVLILSATVAAGFAGCGGSAANTTATPLETTYTVTYAANGATGGSVPVDSDKYLSGATVTVLGNTG